MTTILPRGMRRSKFLRLCSRAPLMWMCVAGSMIANLKRIQKRAGANAFGHFFRLGFAAALAACAAQAAPVTGLRDGEALTYSVRWGLIPSVGRIKIAAEIVGTGTDAVLRVTTTTASWGLARGIFPFDARGESIYSVNSGHLLSISEWSTYRSKETKDSITFDYGKMTAMFSDDIHPEKSHSLQMPEGDPSDLILALIQTRNWNLTPGQSRDTPVIFKTRP